jgi:hypothetical protein
MKRVLSVFFIALLVFSLQPALAMSKFQTRDVQEKLLLLGYEPGSIDGIYGKKTRAAVLAFQADAKIKVDGKVGPQTRTALESAAAAAKGESKKLDATYNQLDIYEDVLTDRLSKGDVQLASRYGKMGIIKGESGRAYTFMVNNSPAFTSAQGIGLPRISRTFEVPGEDVVLLTSASSDRNCPLKHSIVALRADNSVIGPVEIGNCKEVVNGRIQDRSVIFSFPPVGNIESWRLVESWTYENGTVSGP